MTRPHLSESAVAYIDRVERLLGDIDHEERQSLLADLADQLEDHLGPEVDERLGTPEEFVAEYRRSAGIAQPDQEDRMTTGEILATVVSALALPLGVLVLFSFGGQLVFGPFLLAIEWILARVSPRPLRLAWCLLAAALAGEITYLALNIHVPLFDGFLSVVVGMATAAMTAIVFYRTTE